MQETTAGWEEMRSNRRRSPVSEANAQALEGQSCSHKLQPQSRKKRRLGLFVMAALDTSLGSSAFPSEKMAVTNLSPFSSDMGLAEVLNKSWTLNTLRCWSRRGHRHPEARV